MSVSIKRNTNAHALVRSFFSYSSLISYLILLLGIYLFREQYIEMDFFVATRVENYK